MFSVARDWDSNTNTCVEKLVPKEDQLDNVKRLYFSAGLTSGYLARSKESLPKIGDKAPWSANHYFFELFNLTFKKLVSFISIWYLIDHRSKEAEILFFSFLKKL